MSNGKGLKRINGVSSSLESDSLGHHDQAVVDYLCTFCLGRKAFSRVAPAIWKRIYRDELALSPGG